MADSIKCMVVGDSGVGVRSLLTTFTTNTFPTDGTVPVMFDNCPVHLNVEEHGQVTLGLWATSPQEDFDKLRPLSYPQTDVFVLCFSVANRESFEHIRDKWHPEISHHCPGVPVILVGTKLDLREAESATTKRDNETETSDHDIGQGQCQSQAIISKANGLIMAELIKASNYMECSALTHTGIIEVFKEAALAAFEAKHNARSCLIL